MIMRKACLLLFLLILASPIANADIQKNKVSCDAHTFNKKRSAIIANFKLFNVEDYVLELESHIKKCKIDISKYGLGKGIFNFWKRSGWNAKIEIIEKEMKKNYKSQDISEIYIRYKEVAKKLNLTKNDQENIEKLYQENLRDNEKRWKDRIDQMSHFKIPQKEMVRYIQVLEELNKDKQKAQKYISKMIDVGSNSEKNQRLNCSPVDLRPLIPGPIRDQDSIGWCYAFTAAADLLSFKLQKIISASHIAMVYNDNAYQKEEKYDFIDFLLLQGKTTINENQLKGGILLNAIDYMADSKFACHNKSIPSDNFANTTLYDLLEKVEDLHEKYYRENMKLPYSNDKCLEIHQTIQTLFPILKINKIASILNHSAKKDLLDNLKNAACEKVALQIKSEDIVDYDFGKTKVGKNLYNRQLSYLNTINTQLNNKNMVGITYDSEILNNHEHFSFHTAHSSSIVGRRLNQETGNCELLLRNTHGRNCNTSSKHYTCEEDGHMWIPSSDITKVLTGVTYLK